jgi:hypothetical protein
VVAYFAILGPILALSAVKGWLVNIKQRNNLAKFAKEIDDIFNNASPDNKKDTLNLFQGLRDHIIEITIKGQSAQKTSLGKLFNALGYRPITQSDCQLLNNKIAEYMEQVRTKF